MNEENKKWPEDVLERLEGYAERLEIKIGEAANRFEDFLKNEYNVENPMSEDPFYLTDWAEQFVIETRNLGVNSGSSRETETYVGMFIGIEDNIKDNRANVRERALSLFDNNSDRAISEGKVGVLTAKEGMWHINGEVTTDKVDGSDLPWYGFEHGDMILCLMNTNGDNKKPMAPASLSRTLYFLGAPENGGDIQKWRVNLTGKSMGKLEMDENNKVVPNKCTTDVHYNKWKACKIQVIPPKPDRDTLYTNRDFHEKVEYTDDWLPEHLRQAFTPERLLINEQMHNEYVELSELVDAHADRKITTATGATVNPIVITKGYVTLLNKEAGNSSYDQTGRSYRMSIYRQGLQPVTVWISGRMHDEEHPFEYENKDGEWQAYAERTQVIVIGRLRLSPYNNEMQASLNALGIYVPPRTARPAGGSGSTSLSQFKGDES